MPKKPPKLWWPKYLATLGKSGNEKIACKAAGVNFGDVNRACALYPSFAKRRDQSLAAGLLAQSSTIPGRRPGRPYLGLNERAGQLLLNVYGETGSAETAAVLLDVSTNGIRAWRKRDPVFAADWNRAREQAEFIAAELGPWWQRELALIMAYNKTLDIEDAATAARVPPWLAGMICHRQNLTATQAKRVAQKLRGVVIPTRFSVDDKPSHVRAHPTVQRQATEAELKAMEAAVELERAAARMTPEQKAVLAAMADDKMTPEEAANSCGRTLRELEMWADSNAYIRACLQPG